MSTSDDQRRSDLAPIRLAAQFRGYGCHVPEHAPPRAPLNERVDLDEIAKWTKANQRAIRAYETAQRNLYLVARAAKNRKLT